MFSTGQLTLPRRVGLLSRFPDQVSVVRACRCGVQRRVAAAIAADAGMLVGTCCNCRIFALRVVRWHRCHSDSFAILPISTGSLVIDVARKFSIGK